MLRRIKTPPRCLTPRHGRRQPHASGPSLRPNSHRCHQAVLRTRHPPPLECAGDTEQDPEDYNPEYATYLLASMLTAEDLASRREKRTRSERSLNASAWTSEAVRRKSMTIPPSITIQHNEVVVEGEARSGSDAVTDPLGGMRGKLQAPAPTTGSGHARYTTAATRRS
jgi:hypothetical protein